MQCNRCDNHLVSQTTDTALVLECPNHGPLMQHFWVKPVKKYQSAAIFDYMEQDCIQQLPTGEMTQYGNEIMTYCKNQRVKGSLFCSDHLPGRW